MASDTADLIRLMDWAARHGLRHMAHDDGKTRVDIRRDAAQSQAPSHAPAQSPAYPAPAPSPAAGPGTDSPTGVIRAPLAGICHLAPDHGARPFVQAGDRVRAGQTLCLIEAMKVMTALPAPAAGTVTEIVVQPGATVATDDILFRVTP